MRPLVIIVAGRASNEERLLIEHVVQAERYGRIVQPCSPAARIVLAA